MSDRKRLTHLSLFSGIGGIDLAAEWAGFTTIGQCEWADYPTKVLEKHWPNVPRWRDVRDVTVDSFRERTGLSTVDLVSGGYPCQPFSAPGKRMGKDDERYLWPEMFRIIRELRPTWIVGENVAGHIQLGLDDTLRDLESIDYSCRAISIPAAVFGANHERYRVFVVGNSNRKSKLQAHIEIESIGTERRTRSKYSIIDWQDEARPDWPIHPSDVLGTHNGIPNRVDRGKALGNAVVPWQVYPILKAIADVELVAREPEGRQ